MDWPLFTMLTLSWLSAMAIGAALGISMKYAWEQYCCIPPVLPPSNVDEAGEALQRQQYSTIRNRRGRNESKRSLFTIEQVDDGADDGDDDNDYNHNQIAAKEPYRAEKTQGSEAVSVETPTAVSEEGVLRGQRGVASRCSAALIEQMTKLKKAIEAMESDKNDIETREELAQTMQEMRGFFGAIQRRYGDKDRQTLYAVMSSCCNQLLEHDFLDILRDLKRSEVETVADDANWVIEFCVPHIWSF